MAVKPDRIQAKQVFAYVGTTPTRRVQSFDWTSNYTIDSVFELGNAGIVEDAITLVESSITLNSNEWGTTDLEAMMFNTFVERNIASDKSANANTVATINISSFGAGGDWSSSVGAGDWIQITRFNANPTTNAVEYAKVSDISYVAASKINIITLTGTTELDAIPTAGDIVSLVNGYTITQDTVDSNPVHFVLPHRYSSTATTILHSVLLPRCYVDSLTYRIDTGGASEQSYSLVGEQERMTLGSRREAFMTTGSFIDYTSSGKGTLIFRVPLESMASTASPYICYAGANLAEASAITHVSGEATVLVDFNDTGLGLDGSTDITYYATKINKDGYLTLKNISNTLGKVTKGYVVVEMRLGNTGDYTQLKRVTGIDINIPLTRESIDELGEDRSIAKPMEGNLRQEVTLTFNRNDLREFALMIGSEADFDSGDLTEILSSAMQEIKTVSIVIKLYNSKTTHTATTLLKTFTFDDCNFIGDTSATPISGASSIEFKFSTQSLNIAGSGLPPTYS